MKDFYVDSYGAFNFEVAENNKAVRSALAVFLDIRASNGYDDGELEYDTMQGLDFDLLLDNNVDDDTKMLHVSDKIKLYFTDIEDVQNVKIAKDKEERGIVISFEYKTIYSGDYENMEVVNSV